MDIVALILSYSSSFFAFLVSGYIYFFPGVDEGRLMGTAMLGTLGLMMLFVAVWHNLEVTGVVRPWHTPGINVPAPSKGAIATPGHQTGHRINDAQLIDDRRSDSRGHRGSSAGQGQSLRRHTGADHASKGRKTISPNSQPRGNRNDAVTRHL